MDNPRGDRHRVDPVGAADERSDSKTGSRATRPLSSKSTSSRPRSGKEDVPHVKVDGREFDEEKEKPDSVKVSDHPANMAVPNKKGTWRNLGHWKRSWKEDIDTLRSRQSKYEKGRSRSAPRWQSTDASADWSTLATVAIFLGYESAVLGTMLSTGNKASQVLFLIAILLYTITTLLVLLQRLGEIKQTRNVTIASVVFCFLTAILVIAGMAVWGSNMNAYRGTVHSTSACFALLAGIFLLVGIAGGGKVGS